MDQKEFEDKLSEVAIWAYVSSYAHGNDQPLEIDEDDEWEYDGPDAQVDSKLGFKRIRIIELKNNQPCDACGLLVKDRVINSKTVDNPKPHWRHKCSACANYKNPFNGLFNVTPKYKNEFFLYWLRNKDNEVLNESKFLDLIYPKDK